MPLEFEWTLCQKEPDQALWKTSFKSILKEQELQTIYEIVKHRLNCCLFRVWEGDLLF